MRFIKISLNENMEQIININMIYQLVKGEDLDLGEKKFFPSFTLFLKDCGPIRITEDVYKEIKEKIKDLTI